MSWLARSIANTLKFDDVDENEPNGDVSNLNEDRTNNSSNINARTPGAEQHLTDDPSSPSTASPRGVKDDLSEITKTLSRQLWGVASFLAPPPQSDPYKPGLESGSGSDSEPVGIMGIRSDFAEIGGKFRTGISMFSSNIAVSEITKMASNFLQLGSDNEEDDVEGDNYKRGAVGVTDEVVSFARDIAMHPETWLDFPLPETGDDDDFKMSDAQQEHALAVEHLAPRLAALRIELCPGYMSENCFWKIYFVLLHPRLDKEDSVLLSTPQIVKARASLSQELHSRSKTKVLAGEGSADGKDNSSSYSENVEPLSVPSSSTDHEKVPGACVVESSSSTAAAEYETEKHPVRSRSIEVENVDKPAIPETFDQTKNQALQIKSEENDDDDWLKEESSEVAGVTGATVGIENEEDVSFSDLEEDDDDVEVAASRKKASYSSDKDSRDWVQL